MPIDADQPNSTTNQLKSDTSEKEAIMRKLVALMKEPDNEDENGNDRILAAMIRMIRVLNQHVSREELDRILEDLEETLRGN